jgi:uncharacterized protein with HEPN domain
VLPNLLTILDSTDETVVNDLVLLVKIDKKMSLLEFIGEAVKHLPDEIREISPISPGFR